MLDEFIAVCVRRSEHDRTAGRKKNHSETNASNDEIYFAIIPAQQKQKAKKGPADRGKSRRTHGNATTHRERKNAKRVSM